MNHLVYYLPLLSIIVSTLTAFANPLIDVSLSDELELRGVAGAVARNEAIEAKQSNQSLATKYMIL